MAKIHVEVNTQTSEYSVIGEIAEGREFVISGPWATERIAKDHAELVAEMMNQAVKDVVAQAKARSSSRIILA